MTTDNMDSRRMRAHNSQRVLRVVKKMGPLSRADITRSTRLSPPTVSALINCLLRAGLVEEQGEGISSGGRKPQLVSFNSRCGVVLGANIGTTAAHLVLSDMSGSWLARREVELSDTRPRPLVERLAREGRSVIRVAGCEKVPLMAWVVGAPGMTDMERGVVLEAANLDGWVNVPARDMLCKALGGVGGVVDNDVNLAAVGEHWRGLARRVSNFVFVSMGTGIGAGIIIEGKIHRGHRWHAGEISHLNVDFREWESDFGAAGYLESYLGAPPRTRARRATRRNRGELDDDAVARFGAAIANVATVIDPEIVIFGGRVALAQPGLLTRVHRVAATIAPNCPDFRLTELGEDAALYGSVRVALDLANESLYERLLHTSSAVA